MMYIPRRIEVQEDDRSVKEYTDTEFFSLLGPLVVLGEPGSGKTELVKQLSAERGYRIYSASSVSSMDEIPTQESSKLIIDGLDEVTAYQEGAAIGLILSKIKSESCSGFIFTCRIVDWQHETNLGIIQSRWRTVPRIGKLLPLRNEEIIGFINSNGEGQDGQQFFNDAEKHGVADLLRNPQTLKMLLKTVRQFGWPNTRNDLFDKTCTVLVGEDNKIHKSLGRSRPGDEVLLRASGFVCAQLILSNTSAINIDGQNDDNFPVVNELLSGDFDEDIIRYALSTKIFQALSHDAVEPCHRTIAEYLAAKWIASALLKTLSFRRLENLLYGANFIVPAALRGVHSWLASNGPDRIKAQLIERDPYGIVKYGDPAMLTNDEFRYLLRCLEKLSRDDPYFMGDDWRHTFGRGLARRELKDEILQIISDPSTAPHLSRLIIESIQDSDFVALVGDDLKGIIINKNLVVLPRQSAYSVIKSSFLPVDWQELVRLLIANKDYESGVMAIKIIGEQTKSFDGILIGEAIVSTLKVETDGPFYAGLGFGLQHEMTTKQLLEGLDFLSRESGDEDDSFGRDSNAWIAKFLNELFKRDTAPAPVKLWKFLSRIKHDSYSQKSDLKSNALIHFLANDDYRREVQISALTEASTPDEHWLTIFHLQQMNDGLRLNESDVIFHLDYISSETHNVIDWPMRWANLMRFAYGNFTGAFEHGTSQAAKNKEMGELVIELTRPPEIDHHREFEAQKKTQLLAEEERINKIHKSYEDAFESIKSGDHTEAIFNISEAFLGLDLGSDAKDAPLDRIGRLAGKKVQAIAGDAISTVIGKGGIPSQREIAKNHAAGKVYHVEYILLAYCVLNLSRLNDEPINVVESALAAIHGLPVLDDNSTVLPVKLELERLVFSDKERRKKFFSDTIEPHLEAEKEYVPGLYYLEKKESEIAASLFIDWLTRYPKSSVPSLKQLLKISMLSDFRVQLMPIIEHRLNNNEWQNEEQRGIIMAAAFLLNFEDNMAGLDNYAAENRDNFWSFYEIVTTSNWRGKSLTPQQNFFLVKHFCGSWTGRFTPEGGLLSERNPWEASEFIYSRINDLASDVSDEASYLMKGLLMICNELNGYGNHVKHVAAQQSRKRAEVLKEKVFLDGVRNVLLEGTPKSSRDIQSLLMDELEFLQRRVKYSATDDYLSFWNEDVPHNENYCRNRIVSFLGPHLERYEVRPHIEGAMANDRRCDFLNTHANINLPVEVKGQWHDEIWTAAANQLQSYTLDYRSGGFGIYLVIWFGETKQKSKNPRGWSGQKAPTTFEEMNKFLQERYSGLSWKTKIFLLDVSK